MPKNNYDEILREQQQHDDSVIAEFCNNKQLNKKHDKCKTSLSREIPKTQPINAKNYWGARQ